MADEHNPEQPTQLMHRLRHSAAHLMAEALLGVYPEAKIAIGPAIDTGFYYDFDLGLDAQGRPRTFAPGDLAEIEKRMRQIIAGKHPFQLLFSIQKFIESLLFIMCRTMISVSLLAKIII